MSSEHALSRVARSGAVAHPRQPRATRRTGRAAAALSVPTPARSHSLRLGIIVVAVAAALLLATVLLWSAHSAAHQAVSGQSTAIDPHLILQPRTAVQSAQVGGLRLLLTASPRIPGSNHFEVRLGDRGRLVNDARIWLIATMPGMGGHAMTYQLRAIGAGRYITTGPLTMFGHWQITAMVSRPGASALTHAFGLNLNIPSGAFQAAAASSDVRQ